VGLVLHNSLISRMGPVTFSLLLTLLSISLTGVRATISAAEACVAKVPGLSVTSQSSPNYASLSKPFNLRLHPQPALIVTPYAASHFLFNFNSPFPP